MTPKEQKQTTIAVAFFILTAMVLGYYFFGSALRGPAPISSTDTSQLAATTGDSGAPAAVSPYLPNDGSPLIDIKPIQNPVFAQLIAPVYPQVSPSDLGGVTNPFTPLPAPASK